jgi:hypothetical protein
MLQSASRVALNPQNIVLLCTEVDHYPVCLVFLSLETRFGGSWFEFVDLIWLERAVP